MATKAELIAMLRAAADFEEKAIPILEKKTADCLLAIRDAEMIEKDKKKMKELLYQLASDSEEHTAMLEKWLSEVERSTQDEF